MIYNDDVNLNEGSETPRALLGQIFSTLFNIAAWVGGGGGGRDDGGYGQHGGGGQEQDDGGNINNLCGNLLFGGNLGVLQQKVTKISFTYSPTLCP